jgi:autophagy-related protein 18
MAVLAGDQPGFSPRRLRIWNTKKATAMCGTNFLTKILAVKLNRFVSDNSTLPG